MNRPLAWLWLALLAAPVLAADPPAAPAQEAPAPSRPVLTADLRAEYLAGEPILVRFDVASTATERTRFADLSSRPHLVRFELTGPDGKKQVRFNTPPAQDSKKQWELAPRARRQVLLQIPSSAVLKPGRWTLRVRVLDDAGEVTLPDHSFVLAGPRPVGGSLVHDPLGTDRGGHQAIWLHKASDGYDLYLHHSEGKRPERTLGDYFLAHLDERVDPLLTHSRPTERSGRFVYWQVDDRTVSYLQLDGQQARGQVRSFRMPWPQAQVISRGATDSDGGLHVPLWVPAPKGSAGELRVASVRGQDGARFRSVVRLPRAPAWVESTVDASGALRLLIAHDGFLDLYTVAPVGDLPAAGRRVGVELAPQVARFGYLPDHEGRAGGLAILGLYRSPEGLAGRWTTLGGAPIHAYAPIQRPPDMALVDLMPRGREAFAAVYAPQSGPSLLVMPGLPAQAAAGPEGSLLSDGSDGVLWRYLTAKGGPVATVRLVEHGG